MRYCTGVRGTVPGGGVFPPTVPRILLVDQHPERTWWRNASGEGRAGAVEFVTQRIQRYCSSPVVRIVDEDRDQRLSVDVQEALVPPRTGVVSLSAAAAALYMLLHFGAWSRVKRVCVHIHAALYAGRTSWCEAVAGCAVLRACASRLFDRCTAVRVVTADEDTARLVCAYLFLVGAGPPLAPWLGPPHHPLRTLMEPMLMPALVGVPIVDVQEHVLRRLLEAGRFDAWAQVLTRAHNPPLLEAWMAWQGVFEGMGAIGEALAHVAAHPDPAADVVRSERLHEVIVAALRWANLSDALPQPHATAGSDVATLVDDALRILIRSGQCATLCPVWLQVASADASHLVAPRRRRSTHDTQQTQKKGGGGVVRFAIAAAPARCPHRHPHGFARYAAAAA